MTKPDKTDLRGTARNLNQFPDRYMALAVAFEGENRLTRVVWEFPDEHAAKHERFRLYSFKRTIERRSGMYDDYVNFMRTRVRVSGCQLIIEDVNAQEPKIISMERGTPAA